MAYHIPIALSPIQCSRPAVRPAVRPVNKPTAKQSAQPAPQPYVVLEHLGAGTFGQVKKIKRTSDGKILALKIVDLRKVEPKRLKAVDDEVRIHCSLDHPFIVKVESYEYDEKREFLHIFMDICEGGDLDAYITEHHTRKEPIPEQTIWKLFSQLVLALHYCHDPSSRNDGSTKYVIHRDLKPANIFMTKDHKQVRLGDFGLAKELKGNEYASGDAGTPGFMAPECHRGEYYDQAADIWSLGAILSEMCTLEFLVDGDTDEEVKEQILAGVDPEIPAHYSPELKNVVHSMLAQDHLARPTTHELLRMASVQWGITLTTCDKDDRALRSVHRELKLEKVKVADLAKQAKQDAEKVRDLEQRLAAAENSVKTRTAALNNRERALNKKEANLQAEATRSEAKMKKEFEAKELQLLQDRLAFAAVSSRRKIENKVVSTVERRSYITSNRSNITSTTNTASAVSDAVRCNSEARSSGSTLSKASILPHRQFLAAQPTNNGLHRVAKRYNLRNQAVTAESAALNASNDTTLVSRIPRYKLRSDGDLESLALRTSQKENIPSGTIRRTFKGTAVTDSSCNPNKSAVLKSAGEKKIAARAPKPTPPCAIPVYHLRSAVVRKNNAMDLRRAV